MNENSILKFKSYLPLGFVYGIFTVIYLINTIIANNFWDSWTFFGTVSIALTFIFQAMITVYFFIPKEKNNHILLIIALFGIAIKGFIFSAANVIETLSYNYFDFLNIITRSISVLYGFIVDAILGLTALSLKVDGLKKFTKVFSIISVITLAISFLSTVFAFFSTVIAQITTGHTFLYFFNYLSYLISLVLTAANAVFFLSLIEKKTAVKTIPLSGYEQTEFLNTTQQPQSYEYLKPLTAEEMLLKLKTQYDNGEITQDEFQEKCQKIISQS